jgi:hypothetical protein
VLRAAVEKRREETREEAAAGVCADEALAAGVCVERSGRARCAASEGAKECGWRGLRAWCVEMERRTDEESERSTEA